ncbi:MAG: hypothetical protein B6I31_03915 [Desulfobacteraceae bacterium 4572_19]|nr:MAG: hypothetical protein B6I31_03915 [Desulfobacteraceae bacterium 4572_19]
MSKNVVNKIDEFVKVKNVLISVSDKTGLDTFVPELIKNNPDLKIFSTGGTFSKIQEIIGSNANKNLIQVSDYTGQPETQGGLVKTLDFRIYLGLLTETYNKAHIDDINRTGSEIIDMVVVNLYPFKETIAKKGVTVEDARGNIDIGGPTMIRAAAKNFIRVTSVVNPEDYQMIVDELNKNSGKLSLELRFNMAKRAFEHTAKYDRSIADFLSETTFENVNKCYDKG